LYTQLRASYEYDDFSDYPEFHMFRHVTLLILSLVIVLPVFASNQEKVDRIVKSQIPPFGVVFEIVEGSKTDMSWAIAEVKKYAKQLRQRFPELGIAVVSHGREEFALMKSEEKNYKEVHAAVKSLVTDDAIPVHVCGTHASWLGKSEKDFPDYVDVTPAGPTQIANYVDMGYEKIVLEEPR
jgi:intracellular sulfur oxidation DsrE/DsrF family protein